MKKLQKLLNHLRRPAKEEKPEWNQLISDPHHWFNVVETEEDHEEITEAIVISKKRKHLATICHRIFLHFREAYPEIS